ncbi:hypothetical protein H0H87_002850 [Tephrocybe sp. NHM501043]|nr:hypothetical protein H0H87_002850 [Tephrocybe sp. NHM501043]
MANGPPTPPPTTEAEIQDEARLNQAAQGATTTVPPPAPTPTPPAEPDVFQEVFPVILELASQSNFRGLIQAAENATINVRMPTSFFSRLQAALTLQGQSDPDSDRRLTRLLVLGPLIIAYLIVDDLQVCLTYFLPAMINLWKHVSVYSRAQELRNLVNVQGFFDGQLASLLTSLLSIFVQSFRQRTVALLSVAYTSLPVPLAQRYLGMEQVELLAGKSRDRNLQ